MRPIPPRRPLRRSEAHAWRPLTGVELHWAAVALQRCGLAGRGPGRPAYFDALERLEACLEACARRLPWAQAATGAAPGLAPDTLRRTFARWGAKGLWREMLRLMGEVGAPSAAMEWFVCLAYRRGWRLLGIAGIVEARRLGFASALRAPPSWLPDPDLSAYWWREVIRPLAVPIAAMDRAMARLVGAMLQIGRTHHGVASIPAWAKKGW